MVEVVGVVVMLVMSGALGGTKATVGGKINTTANVLYWKFMSCLCYSYMMLLG